MSAYRAFAAYYDRLTREIDYPGREAYFDRLIRQHLPVGIRPGELPDGGVDHAAGGLGRPGAQG